MIRRSRRDVIVRMSVSLAALAAGGCADQATPPVNTAPPMLQLVESGFDQPVFLTAPPGDASRLFVVEQTGLIRIVLNDAVLPTPFLDLTDSISCCGEQGLLGLAFHPAYASNGYFYVNYTNLAGDSRVKRYHVSASPNVADPASATLVLSQTQPYSNHNGGMLAFGPDGFLYIGLGDGGSGGDPLGNGQNRATLLGKMLRVDVSSGAAPYTVPATNPFVGQAGVRAEIWSLGLRNPWRYSFDRQTGDLYIGDVGQGGFEEIDVEPAGAGGRNYGWNLMEGSSCYAGCQAGLTLPAHEYDHGAGCSVTGGYVYRGQNVPSIVGWYFYSDYCNGWVRSFRWDGSRATDDRDWPALAPGGTVSSFGEDGRGELYVIAYGNGSVYRFVPAPPL